MGVNAEGKISLSVELQNFKNIASDLKRGLSAQLKQVPLDVEFNNKDLEKKAAEAIRNINEILSKSRVKNLDLSSILPNFVNEINKEGISDEIRMQMVKGFESALTNLKDIGIKQDYSKLKGFSGEDLKGYIADLNDVMDILKTIEGLTERQKQGILTTVLPSLSNLSGRGKDAAKKEYTKGAKKLDAILQLSGDYNDVLQYGVNPTATLSALNSLNKKTKSGNKLTKNEGQDLLGYLLRGKYLGLEFGKVGDKNLEDLDYDDLLQSAKENLDKATIDYIEKKSTAYFAALDKIYNSSAQEITYSDLTKGIKNTTNQKMQNMFDTEAPENPPTRIRAGSITKRAIKLSSKEKPELRKRTQNEDKKDTKRTKLHSEEELKDSELDNEEKSIEEIEKKLQEIENKLSQVRDKIAKSKDDQAQLEEQITNQEKIFEEKSNAYTTYKNNYQAYANYAKNAKYEADALKGTISNLDEQLEQEKQKKEQIEARYNQLIKKREELKKEIEEKEKQLEMILPSVQEQESNLEKQLTDLNNKKVEKQKNVKDKATSSKKELSIEDKRLKWYDEILQKAYNFKGSKAKSEAFEELKKLGQEYIEFRRNQDSSTTEDKEAEAAFAIKHYKLWQVAKDAGVAESRLNNEKFDTDDDLAYQQAVEYLQKQRANTEKLRENIKAELEKAKDEVTKIEEEINQIKAQQKELQEKKKKLLYELRVKPAENEAANESEINREQIKLDSSNAQIQKIEAQKTKAENDLKGKEEFLQKHELTEERKKNGENRIEKLRNEKDAQEKLLEQKKESLQTEITKQDELIQLEQQLQEKQKLLIQEQKEAQARQEELAKLEEERRKKAEEEKRKQEEANKNQADNKSDSETGTASKESKGAKTSENASTSIPPEQLKRILDLLENIQKALGTLEDGSDIPSITQSIKGMADALKELSIALGEIKQKNFNLNIDLPNNNPIGQQGEAKRKILKELEQQYNELNSYFVNKYGDDSSAFNALSKLEGGSNYVSTMMSDYSVIGDTNASLSDKIEVYKTLIEQLRNFLIQEGGDINKVLTNVLSPEEIVNKITDDIAKLNPTTAISKIFEDIKVSIDASMAQINTESKGFNFLSGSAEEAAEAKRKFVEANKEVLQSIVASMPKIEQEAKALEKVEEIKEESNKTSEAFEKDESNIEKQKKQAEEIARKKREVQEQYENQFHAWDENGQLSFLDKNDYDLQNEYLELQKQEAEQLAKQAEQNPPKVNIPIEGQISFTNEEDINKITNEVYENSFIANKDGQYSLFRNVEAASNWGQELKEDLQEASKTDFSNLKNQLSLKDWEATIDETNKSVESRFKKIYDSKSFIQNTDLPDDILKTYENISTKNGEGFKATSNLRELKNLGDELQNVKTKLKVSFDEVGNLKSAADPLQTQELLNRYDELVNKIQRLKLIISSPSSQESFLLEEFKQLTEAEKEATNNAENLKKKIQEVLDKTLSDKKFTSGKDTDITSLDNYFRVGSSENLDKVRSTVEEINNLKRQLIDSRDTDGNIIGNPEQVQSLIDKYNNLVKVLESLIVKIKLPDSAETIGLKIAKDAEKAEEELKDLKDKIDNLFEAKADELVKKNTNNVIQSYGALDAEGNLIPLESLSTQGVNPNNIAELKEQQQNVINLKQALDEYIISVEKLKQLRESDTIDLKELKQASEEVDSLKNKVDALIKLTKKGTANATEKEVSGLATKIESLLGGDTNLSDDVSNKLKNYLDILKSGATISKASYESMKADVQQFSAEQKKSFSIWDMMTLKMKEGIAFLATKFSFYQIFNQFRQGFEVIHQFDDALTEMMKVSDETRQSLEAYQKTTFATADAIGSNALQIQNSTADFMRLGMGTNVLCSAV